MFNEIRVGRGGSGMYRPEIWRAIALYRLIALQICPCSALRQPYSVAFRKLPDLHVRTIACLQGDASAAFQSLSHSPGAIVMKLAK